ncbi:hypothetical protein [Luteolibacter sp. Populi]|uniref:hypothetical protein n=1 Tax=Luteolibacter sp. Populi TaxID=3230487 RepID=UPI00346623CC
MKTTIELPDALMHRAKVAAAQRRTTFKQVMIESLEQWLSKPSTPAAVELTPEQAEIFEIDAYGVPVLRKRDRVMTNEMINEMREEMGI